MKEEVEKKILWHILDFLYNIGLVKGFGYNLESKKWDTNWIWEK